MRTLGILGTGLLGASIGMRARERGWHVAGYDIADEASAIAKERGAIDEIVSRDDVYSRSMAIIALPVEATIAELKRLRVRTSPLGAGLVIDIASVKVPIREAAGDIPEFIATHPFAGRERSGAGAADPTLFDGKSWVYVASGNAQRDAGVEAFIREMGSIPYAVDSVEHDRVVACTSHLPQLLAWLFADRYREEDTELLAALSGPVARELQRIARSERPMWREIFRTNRENIVREARELAKALGKSADMLERGQDTV